MIVPSIVSFQYADNYGIFCFNQFLKKKNNFDKFAIMNYQKRDYSSILWISHSAISVFKRCPHLYYLEYIYRNPDTGNRIQTVNPYLSLGSAVHETIESLLSISIEDRTKVSLREKFEKIFEDYRGKRGGFNIESKEREFKKRGLRMVERVEKSKLLSTPSAGMGNDLLSVNLMGREDIRLVGSIDWIEVLPDGGAHIIDFKTGNRRENNNSLQLPIYTILAKENLKNPITKVSYWYLEHDDFPVSQEMGELKDYMTQLEEAARSIENAIYQGDFSCKYPGRCFACSDYEKIFRGEAEYLGEDENRRKDLFYIYKEKDIIEKIMEEDFLDEREKHIFSMRTEKPMSEINEELRLTKEKSEKIVGDIKEKLKQHLLPKELKVLVNLLQQNE